MCYHPFVTFVITNGRVLAPILLYVHNIYIMYTHTHIYIYIYIFMCVAQSVVKPGKRMHYDTSLSFFVDNASNQFVASVDAVDYWCSFQIRRCAENLWKPTHFRFPTQLLNWFLVRVSCSSSANCHFFRRSIDASRVSATRRSATSRRTILSFTRADHVTRTCWRCTVIVIRRCCSTIEGTTDRSVLDGRTNVGGQCIWASSNSRDNTTKRIKHKRRVCFLFTFLKFFFRLERVNLIVSVTTWSDHQTACCRDSSEELKALDMLCLQLLFMSCIQNMLWKTRELWTTDWFSIKSSINKCESWITYIILNLVVTANDESLNRRIMIPYTGMGHSIIYGHGVSSLMFR